MASNFSRIKPGLFRITYATTILMCAAFTSIFWTLRTEGAQVAQDKTAMQHAHRIAQSQPHVKALHERLKKEALSISDSTFRKDALTTLDRPIFSVVNANRKFEAEIIQKLQRESLLEKSSSNLFPTEEPMPFLAAPGSAWLGHHSYPGGLVYHTYANLSIGLRYAQVYREIYGIKLRQDYIRMASILHDSAKTMTIQWNKDGSTSPSELQIAGTSAHHIFAVAEAVFRKYPTDFIITLASAHSPALQGQSLSTLIKYLKAAAIIANVPYSAMGLSGDGQTLKAPPPIESFINHLDDHDFVLTESSIEAVDRSLNQKTNGDPKNNQKDYWQRDEILSRNGDLRFYQTLIGTDLSAFK